ncbi:MAG: hypothetical protein HYY24_10095 [Verrucomicrobia bacterium]|nr:hypothetical protein [Verrucomicrobiota bacterium]
MTTSEGYNRRDFLKTTTGGALGLSLAEVGGAPAANAEEPMREVVKGIKTRRVVQGEPYELAGRRLVFTNWYYVRPGDLDWLNDKGESVYVKGSEGPWGAHYKGVDTPRGLRLVAQKPERILGPLERPSRGVLQEGRLLRGWDSSAYYESKDGLSWEKKADLVNAPGGLVFADPSAAAGERYKSVWTEEITGAEFDEFRKRRPDDWEPRALLLLEETGKVHCIRGAVSGDGIRWTKLPEPLVVEYSDTEIVAYYDPALRKYVMYTRYWSVGPRTARLPPAIRHCWTGVGRRAIGRSESAEFRRFPPSEMILEPTPQMSPADVLYTNCRTTIPGAPDHHLMFPAIWHVDQDNTSIASLSSHDGKLWHWLPGGPLMETPPFGQWDGGCIWTSPNLVEFPDGSFALPYRGDNFPHKYPRGQRKIGLGYALWPKGRLVALEASDRGEFATIALMPPGRKLKINALTPRVGSVLVQVDGVAGRSFADATPISGDRHWTPVTWKGQDDLGYQEGKPIVLRFKLERAKIFGLEFA